MSIKRSDSESSLTSLQAGALAPPIDDEETKQVQDAFSDMITQTCENGLNDSGNIFEHTFIPQDWYSYFFRSVVPAQETIRQHLEQNLPPKYFKFHEHGGDGVRYAFKVLDRRTNQLIYEQMPSYHKYGMRLLFSGPVQRKTLNTRAIKKFFCS